MSDAAPQLTTTSMANLTSMAVGGVPEKLRVATTRQQIIDEALAMWAEADEWFVLGGGSNIVAADDISRFQVLKIESRGVESEIGESGTLKLLVEAGENWDHLVEGTVAAGLTGLEALSGIPGLVGAAPIQNIGAYGAEVAGVITKVEFLDSRSGEVEWLAGDQLGFGYRDSVFKHGRLGVVLRVEFELQNLQGLSAPLEFGQLITALGAERGAQLPVQKIREAVLALRTSKGMVLNPADPDTASCGSFFTNPVVSSRHARTLPDAAPKFDNPTDDGLTVKLSAAWLIEHAGVPKGFRLAGSQAGISTKHTLAITNRGGATSMEILQLAEFVQLRVANQFGVNLVPEPVLVGF